MDCVPTALRASDRHEHLKCSERKLPDLINPFMPNDRYSGRTAPLTSKRCILYIYSTNTGTEYFKHGIYSPFFLSLSSKCSLFHKSNVFGSCIIHILYTECAKIKKNISGSKRLIPVSGGQSVGRLGYGLNGSKFESQTGCGVPTTSY